MDFEQSNLEQEEIDMNEDFLIDEEKLENVLDVKVKNKKKGILNYIIISALSLIVGCGVTFIGTFFLQIEPLNNQIKDKNTEIENKIAENDKNLKEIEDLKKSNQQIFNDYLEGNSELLDANNKLNSSNKQLFDAKSKLTQLDSAIQQKQAELDKANRGMKLFAELNVLIGQYNDKLIQCSQALENFYKSLENNNTKEAQKYSDQFDKNSKEADQVYLKIIDNVNKFRRGEY